MLRPTCRGDLLPLFHQSQERHLFYYARHLRSARSSFHTLSTWPHGAMHYLHVPELDIFKDEVRVVTTSGCHTPALSAQLATFYSAQGLEVADPNGTFANSHVYSCLILNPGNQALLAAYTAIAFEDSITGAPVLYVKYVAKEVSFLKIGSASVGDFLFEHMRMACFQCKPRVATAHILTQNVGYTHDPEPRLDPEHVGAQFFASRLRITERGLDYICCLVAAKEIVLEEGRATLHRIFVSRAP